MLAFLNQVPSRPWTFRSKCGAKCGSNRSAILPGGLYRLPYDVPDSQELNIAQNDMISTYGLSMTQLGRSAWASPSLMAWVKRWFLTTRRQKHQTIPAVHADPVCHL